jgi:hypothetical protein
MRVSRTEFLSSAGAAFAATVVEPKRVQLGTEVEDTSTAGRFSRQVGSAFRLVRPDEGAIPLVLRAVVRKPGDKRCEQFSLVFSARRGAAIPEGTYTLRHGRLGASMMFLSPAGEDDRGTLLRADFNLLK